MIKKIPLPLAGVMLGCAALGNLLQSYSEIARIVCGVIAGILLVLLLLKLILHPGMVKDDLKTPILAGVAATFPMALMLLSVYVKPVIGDVAFYLWLFAIALHIVLMVYFTLRFVVHFDLKNVFTVWFIVYVGIAVAGVSAPAYGRTADIGTISFWFGLVSCAILLVVVALRYAKLPVPDPAKPLIGIFTAPVSLCIAAYVQSVTPKNITFLLVMFGLASALYLFALIAVIKQMFTLPFFPSYAGWTFPFVISAIAAKQTAACAEKLGHPLTFMQPIIIAETIIATVLVAYVLVRFLVFLTKKEATK